MQCVTNEDLETRFREHGLSMKLLYPWWYRTIRAIGVNAKPPVIAGVLTQSFYLWANLLVLTLFAVAVSLILEQPTTPVFAVGGVLFAVNPFVSWLRYRSIRRRIGL